MSWRNKLQRASFRGVPFFVESHDASIGRRLRVQTYHKKDINWASDLGPISEEYGIEAYIVQNGGNQFDHWPERDALIKAIRKSGPGVLIHPYLGRLKVSIRIANISESVDEQGITYFTLPFIQAGKRAVPSSSLDFGTKIANAINSAYDTAADAFGSVFEPGLAFTEGIIGSVDSILQGCQTVITKIKGSVSSVLNRANNSVGSILNTTASLISSPCGIWDALEGGVEQIKNTVGLGADAIVNSVNGFCTGNSKGEVTTMEGESIPENTAISVIGAVAEVIQQTKPENQPEVVVQQQSNQAQIINIGHIVLISVATQVAVICDYSSQEVLEEILENMIEVYDDLLEQIAETEQVSEMFNAVQDMKKAMVESLVEIQITISKSIEHKVAPAGENCLTLAYNQFEDPERYLEIFNQNKIQVRHPAFLPGNTNIKIKSA